jgi:hypothetical protein
MNSPDMRVVGAPGTARKPKPKENQVCAKGESCVRMVFGGIGPGLFENDD